MEVQVVQEPETQTTHCPGCGKPLPPGGARYCPNCGVAVGEMKQTRPPSGGGGIPPLAMQLVIGIVAALVVVAGAAGINHAWPIFGTSGGKSTVSVALPTAAAAPTPAVVEMAVGDEPAKGPKDAKVTIVEFSDFECPYCARFVTETLPSILANYGDKVQFAFRNFPLSQHPYAEKAAEAAECANDQGAFWQYHDLLFQNQTALVGIVQADATNGVAQVVNNLKQYAASLNLDTATFNQCLDSGAGKAKVDVDTAALYDALQKAGVTQFGTPAFFINGMFSSGAYPYDGTSPSYRQGYPTFKQMIDAALAAAG